MPSSLAEFHEWFRKELQRLPEKTRGAVWCALETNSPPPNICGVRCVERKLATFLPHGVKC